MSEENKNEHQDVLEAYKIDHDEGTYDSKVTIHGPKGKSTHTIDHGDGGYSFDHDTVHNDLDHAALEKTGIPVSKHKAVAKDVYNKVKKAAALGESVASETLKAGSRPAGSDPSQRLKQ